MPAAPSPLPEVNWSQSFASTRGTAPPTDLARAVLAGLAPDGGLYVPERLEPFEADELDALLEMSFPDLATAVGHRLLGQDLPYEELSALCHDAFDFEIPLRWLAPPTRPAGRRDGLGVLELFHGPTLAFKDVGARFMARLLRWARRDLEGRRNDAAAEGDLTILVATSGDTGSAVAQAFLGVEGFRVAVLFPRGQVSEAQQKLFTTLGHNTMSFEVDGSFDDCQRLVKAAFADADLRRRMPLGSANSINIARLLPQSFYYFWLVAQLSSQDRARPLAVCTPSGNFGNLTAGLLAQRLGAPIHAFVAATNANDVVPTFLSGGDYEPRPSQPTLANAMDVGDPSNFERMVWLGGGDELALRRRLRGAAFSDRDIRRAIADIHRDQGLLLDPHSAIGWLALQDPSVRAHLPEDALRVFLATAHPAKFADVVESATGQPVELPPALADALAREERVERIGSDYGPFRQRLETLSARWG